jgi:hypothetical protein
MRKVMAALVLGSLALGQSAVAAAPVVKPVSAAAVGTVNNRAVLGLVAMQGASNEVCRPKDAQDKSCERTGNGNNGNNGNGGGGGMGGGGLVIGLLAVVGGIAAAAGGGGGGGGNNPSSQ